MEVAQDAAQALLVALKELRHFREALQNGEYDERGSVKRFEQLVTALDASLHSQASKLASTLHEASAKGVRQRERNPRGDADRLHLRESGLVNERQLQRALHDPTSHDAKILADSRYSISHGGRDSGLGRQLGGHPRGTLFRGLPDKGGLILPKWIRDDPLMALPLPDDDELERGVYDLVNKGVMRPFLHDISASVTGNSEGQLKGVQPPGMSAGHKRDETRGEASLLEQQGVWDVLKETGEIREGDQLGANVEEERATASPRGYEELQDEFSVRNIMIRKGKVIENTPEYASLRRGCGDRWPAVNESLQTLSSLFQRSGVTLAIVDGGSLLSLVARQGGKVPPVDTLLKTVNNQETVLPKIEDALQEDEQTMKGQDERSAREPEKGVSKLRDESRRQPIWQEGKEARERLKKFLRWNYRMEASARTRDLPGGGGSNQSDSEPLDRERAATMIQKTFRGWTERRKWRLSLQEHREAMEQRRWQRFEELQDWLRKEWDLSSRGRVEVHVPSLTLERPTSLRSKILRLREASGVGRTARSMQSDISMCIYVTPFPVPNEALERLIRQGVAREKIRVLEPEMARSLPQHFSLTETLINSPCTLRRIAALCKGRFSVIVPGAVGEAERTLAVETGIPIVGPSPDMSRFVSMKSSARDVFCESDVQCPPGEKILPGTEPAEVISEALVVNPRTKRWLVKLNDEFHGRGHLWLDVENIPGLEELLQTCRKTKSRLPEKERQNAKENIRSKLDRYMHAKCVFGSKTAFQSWQAFASALQEQGGVVESVPHVVVGSPAIDLFIHPSEDYRNASIDVVCTQEQIFKSPYRRLGSTVPQASVPNFGLRAAGRTCAKNLAARGVIGFVTVDFVAFHEGKKADGPLRLWGVDITPYMSIPASTFSLYRANSGARFDEMRGNCLVNESLRYVGILDLVTSTSLSKRASFNTVLERLRLAGFGIDGGSTLGSDVVFIDSLASGAVAAMSAAEDVVPALQKLDQVLEFLCFQVGHAEQIRLAPSVDEDHDEDEDSLQQARGTLRHICNKLTEQGDPHPKK